MKKYFYSHIIEVESLVIELDQLDFSDTEKQYLANLADDSLHTAIMDAILSKLPEHERRRVLEHVALEKHDKVWEIINEHVDQVEDLIKETAEEVKQNLKKDVKEARKIK